MRGIAWHCLGCLHRGVVWMRMHLVSLEQVSRWAIFRSACPTFRIDLCSCSAIDENAEYALCSNTTTTCSCRVVRSRHSVSATHRTGENLNLSPWILVMDLGHISGLASNKLFCAGTGIAPAQGRLMR